MILLASFVFCVFTGKDEKKQVDQKICFTMEEKILSTAQKE